MDPYQRLLAFHIHALGKPQARMDVSGDNSNSIFIAFNLHQKDRLQAHQTEKAENYNHIPETLQGSAPRRETGKNEKLGWICLCKEIDFELLSE